MAEAFKGTSAFAQGHAPSAPLPYSLPTPLRHTPYSYTELPLGFSHVPRKLSLGHAGLPTKSSGDKIAAAGEN